MNERSDNHTASPSLPGEPLRRTENSALSDRVRSLRLPERSAAEMPRRTWLPWTLCVVFALAAAGLAVHDLGRPREEPVERVVATDSTSATPATAPAGTVVLESKGYIVPIHQIQVSPKISGEITALHFKEGDFVIAGKTLLAEIEDINYRADRDHAKAALEEAEQNLLALTRYRAQEIEQAKARWQEADAQRLQLAVDRKRSLSLRRDSAMAARDYEQADSQFQAMDRRAKALQLDYELLMHGPRDLNIRAAEARVREARADLAKYDWQLANCKIYAPVTGIILTKKAEVHNIVNPIAFNISASICEMADLSELEVDLSIQERDVDRVELGQKCVIRPDANPRREFEGVVSRTMPMADRAKGSVSVRVLVHVPTDRDGRPAKDAGKYLLPERSLLVSFLKKS